MGKILDKKMLPHYVWGNECDSWVLVDNRGLSVKYESMPGNTKEHLHFHNKAQQFFYILKGSATFYLEGQVLQVGEHKGVLIHPKTKHYIANETKERVEFLVISQPSTNNDRVTIDK